ncbi:hypothetical protein DB30_07614 [Enhygromyxa salina]|uniref:Uncharacterized protein n=1 Tax=Enhygromyxa salina TaxID=215803 RepID=A0A0C1ZRT0_9BACT|nr:hypothetical protein [Enhygromyxa salina]KIG13768.1 hypothetical protein DB30_07614 [Enhygromyxa salina]
MPTRRACLPLLCALVLLAGFACDEATSDPAATRQPSAPAVADPPQAEQPEPTPEPPVEVAEPTPPVVPEGGPRCDHREHATKPGGEPRRVCIDYTDHKGAIEPRCFEGVELSEEPCPREAVIASCKLPATGVAMVYYEGADMARAKRDCETIDGTFEG